MSKRFNAALRHSVGCVQEKKGYQGIPCDEAGWVNVEQILKYDHIWKDGQYLAGTTVPDFNVITKRWDAFQKIILTEFNQTRRVRAQVLALKVTKEELERVMHVNKQSSAQIGDRQPRQGDLALACGRHRVGSSLKTTRPITT